jgi:cysteine-rich repeat protein
MLIAAISGTPAFGWQYTLYLGCTQAICGGGIWDIARLAAIVPPTAPGAGDVIAYGVLRDPNGPTGNGGDQLMRLSRATGAEIWRRSDPGVSIYGFGAITLDSGGDIIGAVSHGGVNAVIKLSGQDGHQIWAGYPQDPSVSAPFLPLTIRLDANEDIIASGEDLDFLSTSSVDIAKLRGVDGAVLWTYGVAQVPNLEAAEAEVVPDTAAGAGDVIFVANFTNPPGGSIVGRLSGRDGSEIWRVTTDCWGPPVVGSDGSMVTRCSASGGVITKFTADGAVAWTYSDPANQAGIIARDPSGDVIVYSTNVYKLRGSDGTLLWSFQPTEASADLAVGPDGNVFIGYRDIVKISGVDGSQLWQASGDNSYYGFVPTSSANLVAVGSSGVAAGDWHLLVQKLSGADGSDFLNQPECGDGIIEASETCDDGNLVSGDGCDSSCMLESGWVCATPGYPCSTVCGDGLVRGTEQCDDGNTVDGDGCDSQCRLEQTVPPTNLPSGGSVTTVLPGGQTPATPVGTTVTTPVAGTVSVVQTAPETTTPTGFQFLDHEVRIVAPPGTSNSPLILEFILDASLLPAGETKDTLMIFRTEAGVTTAIADCAAGASGANPDPCIAARTQLANGNLDFQVRTSSASDWNFGVMACASAPLPACRGPFVAGAGKLQFKNVSPNSKDLFSWTWSKGSATPLSAFGAPGATTGFMVCLYDGLATGARFTAKLLPGGTCAGKACWKTIPNKGFVYGDKGATPDGLVSAKLSAGTDGLASLKLKGKGDHLNLPSLPLVPSATIQLQGPNGECWENTYSAAGLRTNNRSQVKATSD